MWRRRWMTSSISGGRCTAGSALRTTVVTIDRHQKRISTTQPASSPCRPLPARPMTENGNQSRMVGVRQLQRVHSHPITQLENPPPSTRLWTRPPLLDSLIHQIALRKRKPVSWHHISRPPIPPTPPTPGPTTTKSSPAPNTAASSKPNEHASSSLAVAHLPTPSPPPSQPNHHHPPPPLHQPTAP